jgi:hypothetical protein
MKSRKLKSILFAFALIASQVAFAQVKFKGVKWKKVQDPDLILQLQNSKKMDRFDWDTLKANQDVSANLCKYTYSNKTKNYTDAIHRFTIGEDPNAKRSEMKIQMDGKYKEDGIYQFEGEVRFIDGILSSHHICQVWQNMKQSGFKVLIFNTKQDNNGTLIVPPSVDRVGTFTPLTNVFTNYNDKTNKWLKVNVVHFRKENKVYIYLGNQNKLYNEYTHGPADGDYYFKFGAYGKLENSKEATVEWRNIKMFEGN